MSVRERITGPWGYLLLRTHTCWGARHPQPSMGVLSEHPCPQGLVTSEGWDCAILLTLSMRPGDGACTPCSVHYLQSGWM